MITTRSQVMLDFRQNVRGENDRMSFRQPLDQVANLDDLLGVQPHRRLIENHHIRIVDHGLRQTHALLVSAR